MSVWDNCKNSSVVQDFLRHHPNRNVRRLAKIACQDIAIENKSSFHPIVIYTSLQGQITRHLDPEQNSAEQNKKGVVSASGNRTLVSRELQVHGTH